MKTIVNKAFCADCSNLDAPIIMDNIIVCRHCGSSYLFETGFQIHELKAFIPSFQEERTYKVNQYCPELPERRNSDVAWPLIRERRAIRSA